MMGLWEGLVGSLQASCPRITDGESQAPRNGAIQSEGSGYGGEHRHPSTAWVLGGFPGGALATGGWRTRRCKKKSWAAAFWAKEQHVHRLQSWGLSEVGCGQSPWGRGHAPRAWQVEQVEEPGVYPEGTGR